MAKKKIDIVPMEVEWIYLHDDGREEARRGSWWCPGPPWRGLQTAWVRALQGSGDVGSAAIVVLTTKRHRAGRWYRVKLRDGSLSAPLWSAKGGRWMDVGENYSDAAVRSMVTKAALVPAPKKITSPAVDWNMDNFLSDEG